MWELRIFCTFYYNLSHFIQQKVELILHHLLSMKFIFHVELYICQQYHCPVRPLLVEACISSSALSQEASTVVTIHALTQARTQKTRAVELVYIVLALLTEKTTSGIQNTTNQADFIVCLHWKVGGASIKQRGNKVVIKDNYSMKLVKLWSLT